MNPFDVSAWPPISVVVPVYGCAGCLRELHRRLTATLAGPTGGHYQLVFVNDHSPDESWAVVTELASLDSRVLGLSLSRNFGQHAALTAGLDRATSEWVAVMDCDLQDQPEEIPRLYAHALAGQFDVVFGRRVARQDTAGKQLGGRFFHSLLTWLGGPAQDPATGNFGLFHQRVVTALRQLREPVRAFPLQVRWLGFRQGALDVQHAARTQGRSSYRLGQLLGLASNVLLAYSDRPVRLLVQLGSIIFLSALLYGAWLAGQALLGQPVAAATGLLLSIWLIGGLLLSALGIVGLYVARTFDAVKGRPLYVVREETGKSASY